jgi:hypothetical protein
VQRQQAIHPFTLVLAPKPHQEDIDAINICILQMCINYQPLNAVTHTYLFPIHCCCNTLEGFAEFDGPIHLITLGAMQGFHQIKVKASSKKNRPFGAQQMQIYIQGHPLDP